MRLIKADDVIKSLMDMTYYDDEGHTIHDYKDRLAIVKGFVDSVPTVDAEPVRHGKWVWRYIKIGGQVFKHGMQCSVCAEPALDNEGDDYLTNYCPNCGAKMDTERKEE